MKLVPHVYRDDRERWRDRVIGFVGWWLVNALMGGVIAVSQSLVNQIPFDQSELRIIVDCVVYLLPWLLNIGGLILLAMTRSQMAVGALVAIGVLLVLVVLAAILFVAFCFFSLTQH